MDKIIEVISQVIKSGDAVPTTVAGSIILFFAIVVGVFKQYDLIAGVNTMSKKEKAKMDLDYMCKSFGIIFGLLGLFLLISPFIFAYFNIKHEHRNIIIPIAICSFCVFMCLFFNVIKKNRIYNKDKNVENNKEKADE